MMLKGDEGITTTTVKMSANARAFFSEKFVSPAQAISETLRNYIDVYYETLEEVRELLRANQYEILLRALRTEFHEKPCPEGFEIDKVASELPEGLQKIISEMPPFMKYALEMKICREKNGKINAPPAQGERIQIYVPAATKKFYEDFFGRPTAGYSWVIERTPLYYDLAMKRISTKLKQKARRGMSSMLMNEHPNSIAIGYHFIGAGIEGMADLSIFERVCLEIYARVYSSGSGVMKIYTPVSRKTSDILAQYFNARIPKLVDSLLGLIPQMVENSVDEALRVIGNSGVTALIEKREERYGPRSIFGANGIAIRRLCRYITPQEGIDPEEMSQMLNKVNRNTLLCLEALPVPYWKKRLSSS